MSGITIAEMNPKQRGDVIDQMDELIEMQRETLSLLGTLYNNLRGSNDILSAAAGKGK